MLNPPDVVGWLSKKDEGYLFVEGKLPKWSSIFTIISKEKEKKSWKVCLNSWNSQPCLAPSIDPRARFFMFRMKYFRFLLLCFMMYLTFYSTNSSANCRDPCVSPHIHGWNIDEKKNFPLFIWIKILLNWENLWGCESVYYLDKAHTIFLVLMEDNTFSRAVELLTIHECSFSSLDGLEEFSFSDLAISI